MLLVLRMMIASYIAAFVVLPFAYSAVAGKSCEEWLYRVNDPLDADPAEVLEIAAGISTYEVPYLPAGAGGLVVPGATLVERDGPGSVVIHEAVHHLQIERDGLARFVLGYGIDWVRGVYHGCGSHDSYRGIGYEIQARRFVRTFPDNVLDIAASGDGMDFVERLGRYEAAGAIGTLFAQDTAPETLVLERLLGDLLPDGTRR